MSAKISQMKVLVLNGPNLNLLGVREDKIYGTNSLEQVEENMKNIASLNDISIEFFQSNAEHELIEQIHVATEKKINFIIFNPAAFTHTSIALRDAILAVNIPFFEIHISDILSREDFRKKSYFSDIAEQVYSGKGIRGYELALQNIIESKK